MKKVLGLLLLCLIVVAPSCLRRHKKVVIIDEPEITYDTIIHDEDRGSGPEHWGLTEDELEDFDK